MTQRTLTALYDTYDEAAKAVNALEAAGVPHSDISIVANNEGDRYSGHAAERGEVAGDASDGAGTGATLGTVLGGGAGLLAGLGLLAIPGVGPVVAAGWLVATVTGAGVGAAAGGLAGSLTGAGMSESDAHTYAEGLRRGGTLVTARVDEARATAAMDILEQHGSIDMDERQRDWTASGWTRPAVDEVGSSGALGAAGTTATGLGTAYGDPVAGGVAPVGATRPAGTTVRDDDASMRGLAGASREDAADLEAEERTRAGTPVAPVTRR